MDMRNFCKILTLILIIFIAACSTVTRKEMILSSVDDATLPPHEVFVSGGKLYVSYYFENILFYFSADVPRPGKPILKKRKTAYKEEELKVLKEVPEIKDKKRVILYDGDGRKEVFAAMAADYAPKDKNSAVVLLIHPKEIVLFKDDSGELQITELKDMPQELKISRIYSTADVVDNLTLKIKQIFAQKHPGETRFLFPVEGAPRMPFVYFDTTNNTVQALILPDYYELKKDMSGLGFSVEFIYSFFVKSHFFAIIKSPFTAAWRLLTLTADSFYTALSPAIKNIEPPLPPVNENAGPMDLAEFEKYLDKKIRKDKYRAKATLLIDGEEFFPHFMVNAAKAEKYIFVRLYIFATDPYALTVADSLKNQSNRGVDVRVLIDELNTVLNWTKVPQQPASKDFVMPSIKKYLKTDSKIKTRTHLNTWVTFDHTKVIVIDDKIAYTGGMNFGEDYRYSWHDMMIALEGPFVIALRERFKYAWAFAGLGGDFSAAAFGVFKEKRKFPKTEEEEFISVRPLFTRPGDSEIFKEQREAIRRARQRIYIQNAYFSDNRIVDELIAARKRGVDVRVIIPGKNDITLMHKNNLVKANILLQNGIRVYEYPKMSHVKAAIYDNFAVVGSANFDKMSLYVNQEMSLGITCPKFIEELNQRLFQKDFELSNEITDPYDLSWEYYISSFFAAQA